MALDKTCGHGLKADAKFGTCLRTAAVSLYTVPRPSEMLFLVAVLITKFACNFVCNHFDCLQRNKKLSCRRETARAAVSLNISLSHSTSLQLVPFESLGMVSYSHSTVSVVLSCIVSEISEILVESRDFFIPLHSTPLLGGPSRNIVILFASHSRRCRHGSDSFTWKLHHACLYLVNVHQMAPPQTEVSESNCSLLLIYIPRKYERLSRPGWLTYSGRFTHINGYPSAGGRAQDRQSLPVKHKRSTTAPHDQPYESMFSHLPLSTEYRRVTDVQADRHLALAYYCILLQMLRL